MNCSEFEEIKEKYLNGELSAEQEREVERHLESCPFCQELLDNLLNNGHTAEEGIPRDNLINKVSNEIINEQKQKKILRFARYKNRFSMAVFLILMFFVLNIVGNLLSSIFFNYGNEDSRLYKTQKTAAILTESCFPNVTMPTMLIPSSIFFSRASWGDSSLEIKPYFATRGEFNLKKQIGKEEYSIGNLLVNHFLTFTETEWKWKNGSKELYLYFYHPEQMAGINADSLPINSEQIWDAMDKLPEGTVAELGLSFWNSFSIEDVITMFKDYDLDITWYAITTGFEGKLDEKEHPELLTAFNGVWGIPHLSHNMLKTNSVIRMDDSSIREEYFMDSMKFLVENADVAKKIYRGNPRELCLTERYEYLEEHGIQVYGVVVTGPVKELLKLKELETVHSPALGEIKLWNWYNRNFQGTMY
jgi:hypothetical protein